MPEFGAHTGAKKTEFGLKFGGDDRGFFAGREVGAAKGLAVFPILADGNNIEASAEGDGAGIGNGTLIGVIVGWRAFDACREFFGIASGQECEKRKDKSRSFHDGAIFLRTGEI